MYFFSVSMAAGLSFFFGGGVFSLSKPENGWIPGNYRVEFFVDDRPAETVKFKISK